MGRCLLPSQLTSLRFSQIPSISISLVHSRSISCKKSQPQKKKRLLLPHGFGNNTPFCNSFTPSSSSSRAKAALSPEVPNQEKKYTKVAAESTGPVPSNQLLLVVETAATTGAEVFIFPISTHSHVLDTHICISTVWSFFLGTKQVRVLGAYPSKAKQKPVSRRRRTDSNRLLQAPRNPKHRKTDTQPNGQREAMKPKNQS